MNTQIVALDAPPTPRGLLLFRLALIFGLFLMVGLNSGGFGVILPSLSATYGLGTDGTGPIFVALTAGYLIAALAGSGLTARFGLYTFLTGGLLLFGAGSLTLWLLPPFALALLARLVLGLAGAALETGGNFYVAALPRNTALLNYLHAFFGVGALIGPLVATWLLDARLGWNSLFLVWLIAVAVLSVSFWVTFRGVKTLSVPPRNSEDTNRAPMRATLRLPVVWLAILFLLVYVGAETCVGSWSYTFLTEGRNDASITAGILVSLYWGGLTAGRLAIGWLAERAGQTGQDRLFMLGCIVGSVVGTLLVGVASSPVMSGAGLFIIGFCYGPLYPTTLAVLSRMLPPQLVASAISLITGLSIVGIALFPWLAGILFKLRGLDVLFPYVGVLAAVMVVLCVVLLKPAARRQ